MSFGTDNKRTGANNSGSDEWYTPEEAVTPLLRYIPKGSKILCPFDTAESNYVKVLSRENEVLHSHISEGVDFFQIEKPNVDYIISNPPYSCRTEVIKRLYEWQIPFAMMFNSNGIFDNKKRFEYARKEGGELMFLYPRVQYISVDGIKSAPPYMSAYWCYKMLDSGIVFVNIDNQITLEEVTWK